MDSISPTITKFATLYSAPTLNKTCSLYLSTDDISLCRLKHRCDDLNLKACPAEFIAFPGDIVVCIL
jgi:hypothetical protein